MLQEFSVRLLQIFCALYATLLLPDLLRAEWHNRVVVSDHVCQTASVCGSALNPPGCDDDCTCIRVQSDHVEKGAGTLEALGQCEVLCDTCSDCQLPVELRFTTECGCQNEYCYNTQITITVGGGTEFGVEWWKGKAEAELEVLDGQPLCFTQPCKANEFPSCLITTFKFQIEVEEDAPLQGTYGYFWEHIRSGPAHCSNLGTHFYHDHNVQTQIGTLTKGVRGICKQEIPDVPSGSQTNCPPGT